MSGSGSVIEALAVLIADNDGVDVSVVDRGYVQRSLEEAAAHIRDMAAERGKEIISQDKVETSAASFRDLPATPF